MQICIFAKRIREMESKLIFVPGIKCYKKYSIWDISLALDVHLTNFYIFKYLINV